MYQSYITSGQFLSGIFVIKTLSVILLKAALFFIKEAENSFVHCLARSSVPILRPIPYLPVGFPVVSWLPLPGQGDSFKLTDLLCGCWGWLPLWSDCLAGGKGSEFQKILIRILVSVIHVYEFEKQSWGPAFWYWPAVLARDSEKMLVFRRDVHFLWGCLFLNS